MNAKDLGIVIVAVFHDSRRHMPGHPTTYAAWPTVYLTCRYLYQSLVSRLGSWYVYRDLDWVRCWDHHLICVKLAGEYCCIGAPRPMHTTRFPSLATSMAFPLDRLSLGGLQGLCTPPNVKLFFHETPPPRATRANQYKTHQTTGGIQHEIPNPDTRHCRIQRCSAKIISVFGGVR